MAVPLNTLRPGALIAAVNAKTWDAYVSNIHLTFGGKFMGADRYYSQISKLCVARTVSTDSSNTWLRIFWEISHVGFRVEWCNGKRKRLDGFSSFALELKVAVQYWKAIRIVSCVLLSA